VSHRIEISLIKACYNIVPVQHFMTGFTIKKAMRFDFDQSEYVGVVVWGYGQKEVVRRRSILPLRKLRFEDCEFWAPGTDESLVAAYGDYMQLPPKEKQVYRHLPIMNWK